MVAEAFLEEAFLGTELPEEAFLGTELPEEAFLVQGVRQLQLQQPDPDRVARGFG